MAELDVKVRVFAVEEAMVDEEVRDCESTDGFELDVQLLTVE